MSTQHAGARFKALLVPLVCVVTLLIPALVWLISTGSPLAYLTQYVPPGQTLFAISKLCALLAFALFWLQCMTALARFAPALKGFFHLSRPQHALLGTTTFLLVAAHLGLFIAASSLRTGHVALVLLLPQFDKSFYNTYIAFGALAFWLLVLAVIAGIFRARGGLQWRWIHRAVFGVFALALLHGTAIGSETRFGLMRYVYVFIGLSVATAACSSTLVAIRRRSRRARERGESVVTGAARSAMHANE